MIYPANYYLSVLNRLMYHLGISMKNRLIPIFANRPKKTINHTGCTESAVIVPVYYRENKLHMLFTKRSSSLTHHKGQISFPGGAKSEADVNLMATALRESQEEIGLDPDDVTIVGELDDTYTTTGFVIAPYIGLIPYPYKFTRNPNELDEIFAVPVSALFDKKVSREEVQETERGRETLYFYEYKGKVIWGATARIVKQFLETYGASGALD